MNLPVLATSAVISLVLATAAAAENPGAPVLPDARPGGPATLKAQVRDAFIVRDLPPGAKRVRAWFELPQEEALQAISDLKIAAPDGYKVDREPAEGNRFLYVELADPRSSSFEVVVTFGLERWESAPAAEKARALTAEEKKALAAKLAEFPNGETTEAIRAKAAELTKGESDPTAQARKIFNFIIDNAEYWKKDPDHLKPSGKGSATYCMDSKTGNCTDFHALWQAMTRTVDLPTQFVIGTVLKKELDGVDKFDDPKKEPSYHCWVRTYYAGRGWVYSDVSNADQNAEKKDWYFDHIDANRVAFSCGRNIDLAPKQDGPRLNWFVKCYVEVDGKEHGGDHWTRQLTWKSVK